MTFHLKNFFMYCDFLYFYACLGVPDGIIQLSMTNDTMCDAVFQNFNYFY